jgi:hypothetical protein
VCRRGIGAFGFAAGRFAETEDECPAISAAGNKGRGCRLSNGDYRMLCLGTGPRAVCESGASDKSDTKSIKSEHCDATARDAGFALNTKRPWFGCVSQFEQQSAGRRRGSSLEFVRNQNVQPIGNARSPLQGRATLES